MQWRENFKRVGAVGIFVHERGKDRNFSEPRHTRRARDKIRRLVEKFHNNTVRAPNVLIHYQTDEVSLVKHVIHFANATTIGYVHADCRAVLVDKFVRAGGFLLLRHADKGYAVLREGTAHKLPIIAVACGNDCAALAGIFVISQMLQSDNFNVVGHCVFEFREGQNLHEHCAELNGTFAGNAVGLLRRNVKATNYVVRGNAFAFCRNEQPDQSRQATTERQTKFQRQQADYFAQKF